MRSDRTRGMSVIWSARTQIVPTGSMTLATVRSAGLSTAAIAAPARRPAMRARRTREVEVVKVLEMLEVLEVHTFMTSHLAWRKPLHAWLAAPTIG
jgi:hypothetical protein